MFKRQQGSAKENVELPEPEPLKESPDSGEVSGGVAE